MEYSFKSSALKELRKLPTDIQNRLVEKLDRYTETENPLRFADSIKDFRFGEYRFRIGDYRILFDVSGGHIVILKVGHRRDVYR